jgi:hypothetical protein
VAGKHALVGSGWLHGSGSGHGEAPLYKGEARQPRQFV